MAFLKQNPWFFAALAFLMLLAGVFYGLHRIARRKILAEAEADWAYRVRENMQDLRVDRTGYVRAFTRAHAPRKTKYIAMALASLALLTLPAFAVLERVLFYIWRATLPSRVFEPPFLVWQFSIFFGILISWVGIVGYFVRRYHKRAPKLMRDELLIERSFYTPDKALIVSPNPGHLNVEDYGVDGLEKLSHVFENVLGLTKTENMNWAGSQHHCLSFSDGGEARINLHFPAAGQQFSQTTHPFFFKGVFARADDKPRKVTVLRIVENPWQALQAVRKSGLKLEKSSGRENSRMCSFVLPHLEVFLYRG